MIGRRSALQCLLGLVEAADVASGDRPQVVVVAGEAGIGKTRLLRETIGQVSEHTAVWTMSARPGSTGHSYDAAATLTRRISADVWSAPICAGLPDADGGVVDAVLEALSSSAADRTTLLIVEDVHWIDAASALLVDRISQQPWPRLVLVVTFRSGALSPGAPGGQLVDRLEHRHDVEQIRLERLDRTEVGALIAAMRGTQASSAVVEALHRRSGGVPFVVEELLRCCGPDSAADDVVEAELPWSLDDAVRQQIVGYGAEERTVIEALAILGRPTEFDVLSAVSATDEDGVLRALRRLVSDDVVEEAADDVFWFAHALVADAVEAQLLGRERRRLHERSADVLRTDPDADPASLVRHLLGAGRFDEVADVARRGARRYLDQGSSFQALRLAADGLHEEPDCPELLAVATDAAWRLGFMDEAMSTARRWVDAATEPDARIESLRFLGRLGVEQGDVAMFDRSRTALEQIAADADAEPADRRIVGVACAALAQVQMLGPDQAAAVAAAARALRAAEEIGDTVTAARAAVEGAAAQIGVGGPNVELVDALRRAVEGARQVDDPVLLARAINNLLDMLPPHGDEAATLRTELGDVSRSGGVDLLVFGGLHWWEATAAWASGDLGAYRRSVSDARQWWRMMGDSKLAAASDAMLAFEEGRYADAREAYTVLVARSPGRIKHFNRPFGLALEVAAGEPDRARERYEELLADVPMADDTRVLDDALTLVESVIRLGLDPVDIERDVFDVWLAGHPADAALRRTVGGLLAAAADDHESAVARLADVLAAPDPRLSVPAQATLRTALATSQLALGDRDGARASIRHVLDHELARWPGVRRDRAEQLARRLDSTSARSTSGDLTAREREVAALLVDGLTNGQLAERLFISPKTAAVHVSNILMKLGLSNRAEIAAWAVRNGLDVDAA